MNEKDFENLLENIHEVDILLSRKKVVNKLNLLDLDTIPINRRFKYPKA